MELSLLYNALLVLEMCFSIIMVLANPLSLEGNSDASPFPSDFLFGTASSSYQVEGAFLSDGKGLNNWDVFTHKPGNIMDGSNGDIAVDHYHRYQEDLDLMNYIGVNSYRFSISWARILPNGRLGSINKAGINHYNKLINSLLLKGIQPFLALTHYDIPQELENRYGAWLSPQVQEDFKYYADICFKYFGDRVKYWATFNEPNVAVIRGYRSGIYPPSRCSSSFGNCSTGNSEKEPFVAAHNIILSHAAAVDIYRTKYQKEQGGIIGIVMNAIWHEPISNSSEDKQAAERAQAFYMNWFLDPIIMGKYPAEMQEILGSNLPVFSNHDQEKLKSGLDFIGVNHYTSFYVRDCMFSVCEQGPGSSEIEGFALRTARKILKKSPRELLTLKQSLDDNLSAFPPNFLFGTASSAYQYEGDYMNDGKGLNNWDVYSHKPGNKIVDRSNGDIAVDHYHHYLEDIDLMHSVGVNSYRFSISWARILPQGRFGKVNSAGINFYNKLIDALRLKGIKPFVTLTHIDFPQELEDRYGSWLSPQSQEDFAYFADICFKSFGNRVKYWVTFNEPNYQVSFGYRIGIFPPSRCSWPFGNCTNGDSETEPFIVAHNIILSHAAAVHIYRTKYQAKQGGSIGIVLNCAWYEPFSNSIADKLAAERAQSFSINWFLDPIIFGRYPPDMQNILGSILPEFSSTEKENLKKGLDFIGINHYSSSYVQDCMFSVCEPGTGTSKTEGFWAESSQKNGTPIGEPTELSFLNVYSQGMEKIVTYLKERYHNIPMIITENGYGEMSKANSTTEEFLHDVKRVEYMAGYLDALSTAIRKGADVRGYFAWSLLDNFEWNFGYTVRFGLHHVDYKTLRRSPKSSATWYKKFISEHGKVKDQIAEHAENRPYYS